MESYSIYDGAHSVFADTKPEVSPAVILTADIARPVEISFGGRSQVGRATNQFG